MSRFRLVFAVCALILSAGLALAAEDLKRSLPVAKDVNVNLVERPFEGKASKIGYCGDKRICTINGRVPFGLTGKMPETELASMDLVVADQRYKLDTSDMYNAWVNNPAKANNLKYMAVTCIDSQNCTLRGVFSDLAGTYVAEWQVRDGMPVRTILTDSQDIVSHFTDKMDPKEFE